MIANKYIIETKVGEGKFGQVFRGFYWKRGVDVATTCGVDVPTNLKVQVAIKIEGSYAILKTLRHEATLLHYLYERGSRKTPIVYWYGLVEQNPTLVMPYYEMSLEYYVKHIHSNDDGGGGMINLHPGINAFIPGFSLDIGLSKRVGVFVSKWIQNTDRP